MFPFGLLAMMKTSSIRTVDANVSFAPPAQFLRCSGCLSFILLLSHSSEMTRPCHPLVRNLFTTVGHFFAFVWFLSLFLQLREYVSCVQIGPSCFTRRKFQLRLSFDLPKCSIRHEKTFVGYSKT